MPNEKPDRPDIAQMDEAVERMIRQTPLEVIQRMDERLQELRRTPATGTSRELLRKRAG